MANLRNLTLAPRALLYRAARARRIAEMSIRTWLTAFSDRDDPNPAIIATWEGEQQPNGREAAVFCHFDPHGDVNESALHLLRHLSNAGLDVVTVSNAPSLADGAAQRLAALSTRVVHRRNVGYDFGAYRDGITVLGDLSHYQRLVLVNDSVVGPFASLTPLLTQLDHNAADVWGLTDSYERGWHLQSYFLSFGPRALAHPQLIAFWRDYRALGSKARAIQSGELALSRILRGSDLRLRALVEFHRVQGAFIADAEARGVAPQFAQPGSPRGDGHILAAATCRLPFNPTHLFWETLISRFDFPFVKRDLVQDNPARVASAHNVPARIDEHFGAGSWAAATRGTVAPIANERPLR